MHKFTVVTNEQITPSTILLTLKINAGERPFTFRPGQYAGISFHKHGRPTPVRCFSIVSSPTEQGTLQFSMRTKGRFTRGAAGIKQGDTVTVEGPFGGFVLNEQRDNKTVLLAGGIGITPFMSMIRYASSTQLQNEIRLIFSCQTQDDIPFVDELKQLEKANSHFRVIFFIGQGPTDKLLGEIIYTGRITPELIDAVASKLYSDKTFFICGPPPFMKGMTALLRSRNTPKNRIMTEAFSQGPNQQTGKIRSWPVNIYFMGAIGMVLSSFIVMVVDLFKTLPASAILATSNNASAANMTNSRQKDLDQLVNGLSPYVNTAPASNSIIVQAQTPVVATTQTTPTSSSNPITKAGGASTPTSSSHSPSPSPSPSPTPSPTPSPSPAPTPPPPPPVCHTTPSGVKVCK